MPRSGGLLAFATLVLLLAPAMGLAQVPGRSELRLEVLLVGLTDGETYRPRASDSSLTTDVQMSAPDAPACDRPRGACPLAEPIPYGQRYWADLWLTDASGAPVPDVRLWVSSYGFDDAYAAPRTDAEGRARLILPAPTSQWPSLDVTLPDDTLVYVSFRADGRIEDPTPTVRIAPQDEWLLLELTVTRRAWFDVSYDSQGGVGEGGDARAVLHEVNMSFVQPDGQVFYFGLATAGAWSTSAPVTAWPTPTVGADAQLPALVDFGGGWRWTVRGERDAGEMTMRILVGRAGFPGGDAYTLSIYAPTDAYELKLVDRGAFDVEAGRLQTGHQVGLFGMGRYAGGYAAAAEGREGGLVLADVHLPEGSYGNVRVARGAEAVQKYFMGGGDVFLMRAGACAGGWSLRLSPYTGASPPSVALAHGDMPPLSDWFRGAYRVPAAGCGPSASGA